MEIEERVDRLFGLYKYRKKKRSLLRIIQISIIIFILCFSLPVPFIHQEPAKATWWNAGWSDRLLIPINHSYIDSDLTNFPILFYNTSSNYSAAQSDGDDFVFIDYYDNTTQFNHEIELFNSTTNTLTAWVNITNVSSSAVTWFWVYFGNATCANQENVAGTWDSNYLAVHHFANSTGLYQDSTSNNNDGTLTDGDSGCNRSATGQIGYCIDMDGDAGDKIDLGSSVIPTYNWTIEAWVNDQRATYNSLCSQFDNGADLGELKFAPQSNGQVYLFHFNDVAASVGTAGSLSQSTFSYLWLTYAYGGTASLILYLNETQFPGTSKYNVDDPTDQVPNTLIGDAHNPRNGSIDEFRVSNIVRNTSWMIASYNTMNDPASFLTDGTGYIPPPPSDTDYYVSNTGNDANNGTHPNYPWQNKSKVNTELDTGGCINDGDDIYFKRGDTFDENTTIFLRGASGTSSDPMIIGAYGTGDDPIITTNNDLTYFNMISPNSGWWIFENLHFKDNLTSAGRSYAISSNVGVGKHINNLTVRDCYFDGNQYGDNNVYLVAVDLQVCHNITIENCTMIDSPYFFYPGCENTIVQNCLLDGKGGGQDNVQYHHSNSDQYALGDNHYLYNITSRNCTANAFDIVGGDGSDNYYLKNCTGSLCGNAPVFSIGHKSTNVTLDNCYSDNYIYLTETRNVIIRNCVLKQTGGDIIAQQEGQYCDVRSTENVTIYHNTLISSGVNSFIETNAGHTHPDNLSGFFFKNNIFYSTAYSSPTTFIYYNPLGDGTWNLSYTNSNYSYNMWWRGDGDLSFSALYNFEGEDYNFTTWNTAEEVYNDLKGNASMVNPEGTDFDVDFELNSDSPCIDAGDWLTTTNGGGTGTTITVHEANYFFPGMPIFGISGDNIFIGSNTDLVITAVDYDAETITVNRSITWLDGDAVSLSAYNGSAPDIGAFEYGEAGVNNNPAIHSEYPSNTSTGASLQPNCRVTVVDTDGDTMNVTFASNYTGSWVNYQSNNTVGDGTYTWSFTGANTYNTKYYWRVYCNDSTTNVSEIYYFTTKSNNAPVNSNPSPSDSATGVSLNPNLQITVNDTDGHTMNQTFHTNASGSWVDIAWNNNTGNASLINSTSVFSNYNTAYWWSSNVSDGTDWTNETYSFTTSSEYVPDPPSSFSASASSSSQIDLSWTKGNKADYTRIQRKTGGYPTSISDGTNVYNGTGTSKSDTGVSASTTYYYRAWSWNSTGNYWSILNSSTSATTESGGGGPGPSPGDTTPPTTPANVRCTTPEIDNTPSFSWNASTDTSGISGYYVKIDDGTDTWVGNVLIWTSTTAVEEGSHTFYVKAKDASSNGNIGSYGSCSFTVNTTAVGNLPVADPNGPYTGLTLQNIYFDGSDSYDIDGTITNYTWDFGDGTTVHNVNPTHIYNLSGVYNVTLTVTDNDGLTDSNTTTATIILDSDGDGWSDEIEQSYETNITDPDDYPLDTDGDRIPDEDSPDGKYTGDLDDDNDGLDDIIEETLGSDPKNETDVTSVDIEGITYYLVDTDEDGQSNIFYITITKNSTILGIRNDGTYLIDVDEDSEWDYIYDPVSKTVTPYKEKPSEEFPWLLVIIGIIIATIVIIIILFSTGYIRIEEEYTEE